MKLIMGNSEENVSFNYLDLKCQVADAVAKYEGIVYTADNIKDGKKDLAELRKAHKQLEDGRIAVKKKCLEPYDAFCEKLNEIEAILEETIGNIDRQLKDFEADRIEKKRCVIESIFATTPVPEGIEGWIDLQSIWNKKWLNATYKNEDIEKDIQREYNNLKVMYDTIKMTDSPFISSGLKELKATRDINKAFALMSKLKEAVVIDQPIKVEPLKEEEIPDFDSYFVVYRIKVKDTAEEKRVDDFLESYSYEFYKE